MPNFIKTIKKMFSYLGALSKSRDQIQKYVMKDHGFPFLKWCDTSPIGSAVLVLELSEVAGKILTE